MGDWKPKHLLLAAVALILGLVLGGLGPRGRVRDLEQRVTELRRTQSRDVGRRIFGEVFAPRVDAPPDAPPAEPEPDAAEPDPSPAPDPSPGAERPRVRGPDVAEAQRMKDGLDLRRAQAAAALREQAEATDEQMDEVDRIVADMNADLTSLAEEFVASVNAGEEPTRRDMMSFAADTLDVLMATEDALTGVLDPAQLEQLDDKALDPTAYVDGTIVDVLSQLDRSGDADR